MASYASSSASRSSVRCTRRTAVTPAVRIGSVHSATGRPARLLSAAMCCRSSRRWIARTGVVPGLMGWSVNVTVGAPPHPGPPPPPLNAPQVSRYRWYSVADIPFGTTHATNRCVAVLLDPPTSVAVTAMVATPEPTGVTVTVLPLAAAAARAFLDAKAFGPWPRSSVNRALASAARRAGLDAFTTYQIRHSFATGLRRAGTDVADIQDLYGHTRPETTMIYAPPELEKHRAALEPLRRNDEIGAAHSVPKAIRAEA